VSARQPMSASRKRKTQTREQYNRVC